MRILVVNSHRELAGGMEKYIASIIPGLLRRQHAVSFIHEKAFENVAPALDAGHDIPVWSLTALGMDEILRRTDAWRPDIIYVHAIRSHEMETALLDRWPAILFAHDHQRTCPTGTKCHRFPRAASCTRQAGLGCMVMHYPLRCGGLNPLTMWRGIRAQSKSWSLTNGYQAILVASTHMYQEYLEQGCSQERLHIVPPPGDELKRDALPPAPRPFHNRLLFLGRMMNVKGADLLVRAIPLAEQTLDRKLSLMLAGSGPEQERLKAMAKQLGVDAEFPGWVSAPERELLMRASDLLVVPSVWPEPYGLVGTEAGYVGLPSVAFAVGGITDWLQPGRSGELATADPPTPQGLADAIVRALVNPEHYQRLCFGAWSRTIENSLETHLHRLEDICIKSISATSSFGSGDKNKSLLRSAAN